MKQVVKLGERYNKPIVVVQKILRVERTEACYKIDFSRASKSTIFVDNIEMLALAKWILGGSKVKRSSKLK